MRSTRLALAGVVLLVAACASPAGVWTGSYDNLDRATLRDEVEKTLRADQWRIVQKGDALVAEKRDGGGHSTGAWFTFAEAGKGSSFMAGCLVGRVGDAGKAFLIGERYDGTPSEEGKLYLQIVPSPWNNASTGSYRVRVTTDHVALTAR